MKQMIIIATMVLTLSLSSCTGDKLPDKPDDMYGNYYEIFVASFYDSDGDGMGDFAGITEKMPYLNDGDNSKFEDLMVDGLWLMPIMPSPSYHKYDVTDYKAVAPEYGTMEDFEAMMKATDEAGVDVIIDYVLNHSSREHPWFLSAVESLKNGEENLYIDYYHFSNQVGQTNYHAVPGLTGWYYEGAFGGHMPDLNLDNEALRAEILDIARFWMDKGVDGFRLDAVIHFYGGNTTKNVEFMKWFSDELGAEYEDAYIVCEAWSDGGTIENLYASGVTSFFNFPFSGAQGNIITELKSKQGHDLAVAMEAWQKTLAEVNPDAIDAPFLSNHDNARSGGTLMRDPLLQKMGANIYMLMPGNPFMYYGEEIGMYGSGRDENKRQPLIWSQTDMTGMTNPPVNSEEVKQPETSVEEQLADETSLLSRYRDLLKLKRQYPEIARGTVSAIDTGEYTICAYWSEWTHDEGTDAVVIIHNFADESYETTLDALGVTELIISLHGEEKAVEVVDGKLTIPGKSSAVLK